jgi:hypothetical protein
MKFRTVLSMSYKNLAGILLGIALKLYFNLGRTTDIFVMLDLLILKTHVSAFIQIFDLSTACMCTRHVYIRVYVCVHTHMLF